MLEKGDTLVLCAKSSGNIEGVHLSEKGFQAVINMSEKHFQRYIKMI